MQTEIALAKAKFYGNITKIFFVLSLILFSVAAFYMVQDVSADQLIEGIKYKVELSDGVHGSDQLR